LFSFILTFLTRFDHFNVSVQNAAAVFSSSDFSRIFLAAFSLGYLVSMDDSLFAPLFNLALAAKGQQGIYFWGVQTDSKGLSILTQANIVFAQSHL